MVSFQNVREAMNRGIALIHQELNLASNLDLAANIYLGREPNSKGFIQEGNLQREAEKYLKASRTRPSGGYNYRNFAHW